MIWKIVKHKDLSITEELHIAELKDQHWSYGVNSQLLWMRDNVLMDDLHLMGEDEGENGASLKAYITLSNLKVSIDGKNYSFIGIGGVCVDKSIQHSGTGKQLLKEAEKYIAAQDKEGILLCKDALVGFYEKCGWKVLSYQTAIVAGTEYTHKIMLFNNECVCTNIIIDRNF